jgi:hypothetical protein
VRVHGHSTGSPFCLCLGFAPGSPLLSPATFLRCCVVVPLKAADPLQRLVLVGSSPQLGSWVPDQGLELTRQEGGTWLAEVMLAEGQPIDAKVRVNEPASEEEEGVLCCSEAPDI